jgi:adenylate kinase family enzyme
MSRRLSLRNILIFGNSGSGKSTLARSICEKNNFTHLDLDLLAWENTIPPRRKALTLSEKELLFFINDNESWVIEGCYVDLLELVKKYSNEIIFMDLPIVHCIENAKLRPWEPHKYESKQAQDQNLNMLIDWISQYEDRNDTFSKVSHQCFYDQFIGNKKTIYRNEKE